MKFVCQKATIFKEISLALDFTSQRNSLSIVSNVLLETKENLLVIKATDQKVGFHSQIPVETLEEGSTTVFCDKFLGILRSLPETDILFEEKNEKLYIEPVAQKMDFQLRTIGSDKFPDLEEHSNVPFFTISQKDFLDMVNQTIFAISEDETRYYMSGVYLEYNTSSLIMVATDGRRLSYIERKIEETIPRFPSVIIPAKFLTLIRKMATGEGTFRLGVTENTIFASFGGQFIYSALINGKFPNYRRVIPESQSTSVITSVADILEAVKRVSLFVETKAKKIFLDIDQNGITVSSEENDLGIARETITADYSGEPCRISLNYGYIMSPLRVMEGEKTRISFTDTGKALTLSPEPERDYFHIIMPMQPTQTGK
ncbi:DNA polymerase III subunit beta [Parasphaerochaeta coccoides]|uniref:Beta sliding clamp n=1 Tax=Parasphaerochaeta coccoides (strain ATCC BAA-1237 / DSM 17374 / SPN1) TaxID=760011 RepID=F4GI85_PARC1|nr:DNA polymerase III subunit beta [Parasphaerochaeta coccoides]AEC01244.1 DNA polymerase III, beta subunit [Parasphaerochaeta coccoides DSM 17374]